MKVTEENILKLFSHLGLPHKRKGHQYMIDLLIERDFNDSEEKKPNFNDMLLTVSVLVDVDTFTIRRCVNTYFEWASEVPVDEFGEEIPDPLVWDKRLFLKMLASIPAAYKLELLYTMVKEMKEDEI